MKYIIQRVHEPQLNWYVSDGVITTLTSFLSGAKQFTYKRDAKGFLLGYDQSPPFPYSIIKVTEKELFKAKLADK